MDPKRERSNDSALFVFFFVMQSLHIINTPPKYRHNDCIIESLLLSSGEFY